MSLYQFIASDIELPDYGNEKYRSSPIYIEVDPKELRITEEAFDDFSSVFSDKKFCSAISWELNESKAEELIEYINEHMKETNEVELWTITIEDTDRSKAEVTSCALQELDGKTIIGAMGEESYSGPKCLKIVK